MRVAPAGEYRFPVTIEQPTTTDATRDDFGHIDETGTTNWTTYLSPARARFGQEGGKEVNLAKRVNADINVVIGLRSSPDVRGITRRMRIKTDFGTTRYLNILDVLGIHDNGGEVTLHCQENRD